MMCSLATCAYSACIIMLRPTPLTCEILGAVHVKVDGRNTEAAQIMIDRPRPRRACEEGAPARGVGSPRVPEHFLAMRRTVVGGHSRSRLRRSGRRIIAHTLRQ